RLVAADDVERAALFENNAPLADVYLAHALKSIFDNAKENDPARARAAVEAVAALAGRAGDAEIAACGHWMPGVAALLRDGQAERALADLDEAAALYSRAGRPIESASTQVSKLHALALLGRYDEAQECGLAARDALLAAGDETAAGKIEHNLGNLYFRRDFYQESEQFYRSALMRFERAADQQQLALIETNLATTLIFQHRFREARQLYDRALGRAVAADLLVTRAV